METSLQSKSFCFLGAGSMAEAIVRGLLQQNKVSADNIVMLNRDNQSRLVELQQRYGVHVGHVLADQSNAIPQADIIVIAIKPKDVTSALHGIRHLIQDHQLIISVVAGLSISTIASLLQGNIPIVRTMPNTSSTIGLGATGISYSTLVGQHHKQLTIAIFQSIGVVCAVEEQQLNIVTGLSGSGPAYVYYLIESLISAGVQGGLSQESSRMLAVQTVLGAVQMVKTSEEDPALLRSKVTSPGGTTEKAIETLKQHQFSSGLIKAVLNAADRAAELGVAIDMEAQEEH